MARLSDEDCLRFAACFTSRLWMIHSNCIVPISRLWSTAYLKKIYYLPAQGRAPCLLRARASYLLRARVSWNFKSTWTFGYHLILSKQTLDWRWERFSKFLTYFYPNKEKVLLLFFLFFTMLTRSRDININWWRIKDFLLNFATSLRHFASQITKPLISGIFTLT